MSGERLRGVRVCVDLDDPVDEPTPDQVRDRVGRLHDRHTWSVSLDRLDATDTSSIDCSRSARWWWVTARGGQPSDVAQGKVGTEAAAVDLLVGWARAGDAWRPPSGMRAWRADALPAVDLAPHHWVRRWWEDDAMAFLYEVNRDGKVLRAVELQGTDETPTAAASLTEWRAGQRGVFQPQTPESHRYALRYGGLPESVEDDGGAAPRDPLTAAEFERCWQRARAHLQDHPRGHP